MHSRILLFLLFSCVVAPSLAAEYTVEREGQRLEIGLPAGLSTARRELILQWVTSSAEALTRVYGRWPRDYWRVQVRPIASRGGDPVPWAQVNRGDPDLVSFYIDEDASLEQLVNNWTAYHELSHLLLPYRGWGDMWFSEGLASYYQNLLQARSGIFDEREMWQRLCDGFERGRNNRRPDLTLAQLSPRMRENRSFMRVYWSGAFYFLYADAELRRRTNGQQSLDTTLQQLNACCGKRKLSASEIAAKLDQLTGQALFVPLFDEVAGSRALPDFESLYASLGISVSEGRVSLDETHEKASLRRSFLAYHLIP